MPHQLREFVLDAMQRRSVPGIAVGVLVDGQEHTAGFGVTSVEHPLAVDAQTLMQIGSITKTVTATAIMRLVDSGRVSLDAPVRTYVPDLRLGDASVAERVTLRHVLTHTAGWVGDDFSDTGNGDDALERYVAGLADLPQITPLGEQWSYCNSGFGLAGRVLEVVTGSRIERALTELVLQPLGMHCSFFFPADVMTHRFAVGHFVRDGVAVVARPWPIPRAANAAGGITSNVHDLLRYARFVLSSGDPLLTRDSLAHMHSPQARVGGQTEAVGIAWMLRSVDGTRVVEHSGGTNGQISLMQVVPERDFALAVLTNSERGGELCRDVSRWATAHYLGLEQKDPSPIDIGLAELAGYVGHYDARMTAVDVSLDEGGLVALVTPKGGFPTTDSPPGPTPPPTRLAFVGPDHVLALDPPFASTQAVFVRDAQGRIAFVRVGGRLHVRKS